MVKIIGTATNDITMQGGGFPSPMSREQTDGIYRVEDVNGKKGSINTNKQLGGFPPEYEIEWADGTKSSINKREFDGDVSDLKKGIKPISSDELATSVRNILSGKYDTQILAGRYGKENEHTEFMSELQGKDSQRKAMLAATGIAVDATTRTIAEGVAKGVGMLGGLIGGMMDQPESGSGQHVPPQRSGPTKQPGVVPRVK